MLVVLNIRHLGNIVQHYFLQILREIAKPSALKINVAIINIAIIHTFSLTSV